MGELAMRLPMLNVSTVQGATSLHGQLLALCDAVETLNRAILNSEVSENPSERRAWAKVLADLDRATAALGDAMGGVATVEYASR